MVKTFLIERGQNLLDLLSADEVRRLIALQKLGPKSRVYDEAAGKWMELMLHPDWRDQFALQVFQAKSDSPKISFRPEWYYLVGKAPVGAFTYPQILNLMQTKKLILENLVWRQGMQQWAPLKKMREFQSPVVAQIHRANLPQLRGAFNRRKFNRVAYTAQFVLHNQVQIWKAVSFEIGAGGVGVIVENSDLAIGQELFLHRTSVGPGPNINAKVLIVTKSTNGLRPGQAKYGLEFVDIGRENQKEILNYTQSFLQIR